MTNKENAEIFGRWSKNKSWQNQGYVSNDGRKSEKDGGKGI